MRARIINKSSIEVVDIEAKILKINMIYKSKLASNGVDDDAISKLLGVEERCLSDKNKALLKKRKEIDDEKRSMLLELDQYKEYIPTKRPDIDKFESATPYYVEEGGVIYQKWNVCKNDVSKINDEIDRLRSELSNSDYKVVKCMEAKLLDTEMPYDVSELTSTRKGFRDRINELETLIKQ